MRDEHGVALIAALLGVLILGGLVAVFVATATTTARVSGISRDAEIALHVAEAAADEVIARINWDDQYVTLDDNGETFEVDLDALDEQAQRQWLLGEVLSRPLDPVTSGTRGEGFGIRPVDPDTSEPHDVVFGVGFVPGRDNPQRVRITKLRFDRGFFQPKHGLLSCGDIELAGDAAIGGGLGHLHSNGNVHVIGGSHDVAQKLSAGTLSGNTPNAGAVDVPAPEEFCPPVAANDFYGRAAPPYTCYPGTACEGDTITGSDQKEVLWWDLCPDGTARRAGSAPCTGAIEFQQGQGTANFRGWRYESGFSRWRTQNLQSGVYYVYEANARITGGGQATVSILVDAKPTDNGTTGNTDWQGSATVDAALEGLVLVTDRDLELRGTAGGVDIEGLFAVGEQADLSGTATITGSVYIRDMPHTPNSPVEKTRMSGNFTVAYDSELDVPLLGVVRITHWNEL